MSDNISSPATFNVNNNIINNINIKKRRIVSSGQQAIQSVKCAPSTTRSSNPSTLSPQDISDDIIFEYDVYCENNFQSCTVGEIRARFEKLGFIAINNNLDDKVKTAEELTTTKNYMKLLDKARQELGGHAKLSSEPAFHEKKIFNLTADDDFNSAANKSDDLRRSSTFNLNAKTDPASADLKNSLDKFIRLGLVHPKTKIRNAQGVFGCDVLYKGRLCKDQKPHRDSEARPDSVVFLSHHDMMTDPEKAALYDMTSDLPCSVFVNPTNKLDCIRLADGTFCMLPPHSSCLLRGDIGHFGTENYTHSHGFYKIFYYADPPKFIRAGHKNQFGVFMCNTNQLVLRLVENPHTVLLINDLYPYMCSECYQKCYFTHPLCENCLLEVWHLEVLGNVAKEEFNVIYKGATVLPESYQFPTKLTGDILTRDEIMDRYPSLKGELINAMPVSSHQYFDFLTSRSLLASMQCSMMETEYNVVFVFDDNCAQTDIECPCQTRNNNNADYEDDNEEKMLCGDCFLGEGSGGWLKTVKQILPNTALILKSTPFTNKSIKLDFNAKVSSFKYDDIIF